MLTGCRLTSSLSLWIHGWWTFKLQWSWRLSTRITYIIAPTEGKTKTSTQNLNCIFDLHRQQSFLNSDDYHFEMKKKKSTLLWEFISKRVFVRFWGCWGDGEREECMWGEEEEALILGEHCLAKCRTKPSKLFLISWPEILLRIFKATSSPNEASVDLVLVSSGLRSFSLQILVISSSTAQGNGTILSLFISAIGLFSTDLLKKGSGSAKCYLKFWVRVAGFYTW